MRTSFSWGVSIARGSRCRERSSTIRAPTGGAECRTCPRHARPRSQWCYWMEPCPLAAAPPILRTPIHSLVAGRAFTVVGGGFALNAALDAELYDIGSRSWSLGSPPTFSLSPEPYVAVASAVDHRLLALTSRQEAVAYDAGADYWSRITRPPS